MTTGAIGPVLGRIPARLRNLVAAEWIKVWSLRSTPWLLAVGPVLVLLSAWRASSSVSASSSRAALFAVYDQTHGARALMWLLLVFLAASFGALTMVNEYGSGLVRTTFTAVPDRVRVVAAKAVTVTGLLCAGGVVMVVGSWAITAGMLAGQHVDFPVAQTHAVRAWLAGAVFLPVCGLLGMAVGALVRHAAATMGVIFVALVLGPTMLTAWAPSIAAYTPTGAWVRLIMATGDGPISVAGAWLVYAVWSVLAVVVTTAVVRRRDV